MYAPGGWRASRSAPSIFVEGGEFPALPTFMSLEDTQNVPAYKYQPLEAGTHTVRLIEILPEAQSWVDSLTNTPAIVLRIVSYNLSPKRQCIDNGWEPKQYSALSYVWGVPTEDTWRVYVVTSSGYPDYQWEFGYIRVRKNLHDFLWYYRGSRPAPSQQYFHIRQQYIWIDQLSIHQDNLAERSSQVSLMASIYWQAEQVISWLGCDPTTIAAAKLLTSRRLHKKDEAHVVLLKNEYFTRLWIIQEILLAKKVDLFIPETVASLSALDRAYETSVTALVPNCGPYLVWDHNRDGAFGKRKLVECIERYSGNDCANPRDSLYALLGIVQHSGGVQVDYTKPCSEVYRDGLELLHEESERESLGNEDTQKQSERYFTAALRLAKNMGMLESAMAQLEKISVTEHWKSDIEPLISWWCHDICRLEGYALLPVATRTVEEKKLA